VVKRCPHALHCRRLRTRLESSTRVSGAWHVGHFIACASSGSGSRARSSAAGSSRGGRLQSQFAVDSEEPFMVMV
jgi:hypothetical protein